MLKVLQSNYGTEILKGKQKMFTIICTVFDIIVKSVILHTLRHSCCHLSYYFPLPKEFLSYYFISLVAE